MTGFEVIGVLLGVYPVVIDGLKLCKAVASGQGIRLLVDDLKDEEIRYTESLGHLFGTEFVNELQARQRDAKTPISYPTPRQQTNLEQRLGRSRTELICSTLEGMKNVLESMQRDIEKARAGEGLFKKEVGYYEKASRSLRQFKFIRRKSTFRDRLLQLKKWNGRLRDHLNSQLLPSSTGSWRKPLPLIGFPRQESFVVDIYDAIHNGYQCQCDVPHPARLGLPELSISTSRHTLTDDTNNSFKLIFPFEDLSENDTASITAAQTFKNGSLKNPQFSASAEDLAERFSRRLSITSSTMTMTMTTTSSSSKSKISRSRWLAIKECPDVGTGHIEDLCKTVRALDAPGDLEHERIGVLSSRDKIYELRRTMTGQETSSFEETIDLDDLLASYQDTLFRNYRFGLALRLSYAVLQFYSTPWIEPNWSWKDFTIAMNGDRPQKGDPLFITHNFYSTRRQVAKSEAARSFGFWAGVGEETLTRLGFALIELGLGRRLSELRQDGSIQADPRMVMTTDQDILDFWTAEGVLDSGLLFQEQGEDYEEVVRVLIKHEFEENCEKKLLSSRKPSFYRDVERLVITPLYGLWTDSWGRRASQLSF
ncbi:uncharacterized protein PAC_02239 [Phialocephala subalpina]|uniref:DUF7580 domain-containing protein n=1 Tax=Phialocephala subalpina TaxID=576137 RepID=A0A1L7WHY7_9HELO|nr:uncharacterized protein PAC_02239 [Phialocephala subalpina]